MSEEIEWRLEHGVALITFNRPQQMNTFSPGMVAQLGELYRRADSDDAVRAVVVTGAGAAFCAGADLSQGGATFEQQSDPEFSSCPLSFQAWQVRKPVIAACNGHAVGVGLGIAIQCDLRLFAEEAKYGFLQVRRGVVADFASHHLLPRLVGMETALDLLLSGRRVSGREAFDLGLCRRVLPAHEVLPAALGLAAEMARECSPLAMGLAKDMVWNAHRLSLTEAQELETRRLHHTMGRDDAIEGGLAYVERRSPQWASRVGRDWPRED